MPEELRSDALGIYETFRLGPEKILKVRTGHKVPAQQTRGGRRLSLEVSQDQLQAVLGCGPLGDDLVFGMQSKNFFGGQKTTQHRILILMFVRCTC